MWPNACVMVNTGKAGEIKRKLQEQFGEIPELEKHPTLGEKTVGTSTELFYRNIRKPIAFSLAAMQLGASFCGPWNNPPPSPR